MKLKGAALWVILMCTVGFSAAVGRHHKRHLRHPTPSLDDLLNRLDGSIHDHNKRLQRGLPPTIHYRTDQPAATEEGPTIVQEGEDDWPGATFLEGLYDTSDYVNAAPWTRSPTYNMALKAQNLQMLQMATDNALWVKDNGKCEVPLRKCVPITQTSSADDENQKKYWPRCALLHRCGDDAGCCTSLKNTCTMAESENVDLYFYFYEPSRAGVQMMTFTNHTKCSCQPKSEVTTSTTERPRIEINESCKCPKHFNSVMKGSECFCDCPDRKSTCRKYRRGKRYFSGTDIRCISTKECVEPTCEYGPFVLRKRRCTKRRERERYTTTSK